MATVDVSWETQDEEITNARTFDRFNVQISTESGTVVQEATEPLGTTLHSFLNVAPGDYIAEVEIENAAGEAGAPALTAPFTVPPADTAPVPVTISVNLR